MAPRSLEEDDCRGKPVEAPELDEAEAVAPEPELVLRSRLHLRTVYKFFIKKMLQNCVRKFPPRYALSKIERDANGTCTTNARKAALQANDDRTPSND